MDEGAVEAWQEAMETTDSRIFALRASNGISCYHVMDPVTGHFDCPRDDCGWKWGT